MKTSPIRIAIADDHTLYRAGLIRIIQSKRDFSVIIEASDGQELLQKIDSGSQLPDICIVDIDMQPLNGYDTVKLLSYKHPSIKILALSMYNEEFCIINMLKNGAKGFITKDAEAQTLISGLQQLAERGFYYTGLSPLIVGNVLQDTIEAEKSLSEREMTFLSLCCSEMPYKEIAEYMNISERTVEGYRDNLFKKLNIKTRSGLVMFAMLTGLRHNINS